MKSTLSEIISTSLAIVFTITTTALPACARTGQLPARPEHFSCFQFNWSEEQLERLRNPNTTFTPVFMGISPVINLPLLLGLREEDFETELAAG